MSAEWSGPGGPTWYGGVPRGLQVAGLTTFCVGLAAVAVATCVLSYAGLHAIAQEGGIQARYAMGYPLLIDALLVIVLAAVLALRGAGMPSRVLAWLTLVVLLVAAAGAEALHATGRKLPRDAAAITVAVLPWLLVLVTFVLLLAMLRHARLSGLASTMRSGRAPPHRDPRGRERHGQPAPPGATLPVRDPTPWSAVSILPGSSSRLVSEAAAGAAAGRAAAEMQAPTPERVSAPPAGPAPPGEGSPAPAPRADATREPTSSPGMQEERADPDRPGGAEPRPPPAG